MGTSSSSAPRAAITVLYNQPTDPAAFERYYDDVHVPLVGRHAATIGFTRAELVKFGTGLDGGAPPFYRKAELWFDSEAALRRAVATPEFQEVAADLANFATGGASASITIETHA